MARKATSSDWEERMQNHWQRGDEPVLRLEQNADPVASRIMAYCRKLLPPRFEHQAPAVAELLIAHVIAQLFPCKQLSFEMKRTEIRTHEKTAAHSRPEHTLVTGPMGCGVYCRGLGRGLE